MVTAALISDTLTSIGAVGGLLSIVGTGLLILLVASQSRQIRAMREWIEQEPQRQQETAQRVIAEVQRRIAAARERRNQPIGAPPVGPPAASKVKPAPGTLGATPEAQAIAAQTAALSVPPPTDGTITPSNPLAPGGVDPPKFAPLTPAGEAAADPDEPAIVSEILGQETQLSEALPDPDFTGVSEAAASRGPDARFSDEQFDLEDDVHPRSNRLVFGGGIALVVVGLIFAATQLFGGGSSTPSTTKDSPVATSADSGGGAVKKTTPSAPARSSIAVLVFNATTTSQLGKNNSDALKDKGYMIVGPPQTWSPSLNTASVMYRTGYKAAATEVAKDLGLSSSVVTAIDDNTSVQAGQAAKVVVKAVAQPAGSTSTTG